MAIIGYCRSTDLIFVDSSTRSSTSHRITVGSKVYRIGDWKFCSPDHSLKAFTWAHRVIEATVAERSYVLGFTRGEGWELLLRSPEGEPYFAFQDAADDFATIVPLRSIACEVIVGEGSDYCNTFIAMGKSMEEAVADTAILHPRCAIPIETF